MTVDTYIDGKHVEVSRRRVERHDGVEEGATAEVEDRLGRGVAESSVVDYWENMQRKCDSNYVLPGY